MQTEMEDKDEVEVQMAPLVDCVFLLLIFFLVATTLKKIEKELPLELPEASAAISRKVVSNLVIISIDADANLYLGSEPVEQGFLQQKLREIAREDPERRVRIDMDREAPARAFVEVINICNFEGLKNVGIKTKKPDAQFG
ncbi:MAG: biopolymer transporter ExbD [Planctomycetes bacterium]|nr:biopolymer transporter ExbD [Planctomycetota bacterium]